VLYSPPALANLFDPVPETTSLASNLGKVPEKPGANLICALALTVTPAGTKTDSNQPLP
jgi:hypothetical protein